jgi:NADH-quinone oxidoreductase subunit L
MTFMSAVKSISGIVGSICGKIGMVLTVIGLLAMIFPPIGAAVSGVARVLFNKYWVDELYQKVIVGPLVWFSRNVLWRFVDNGVIDRVAVDGSAGLARHVLGRAGSLLQNGQVGLYVIFFLVGALWILRVMIG